MIRTPNEDLKRELQDPQYVRLYGASDCKAEIAITLCKARQASGKTQKELAESMSLSQPYIAKLEGGEANPTIGTIGSILAVLGCRLVTNTMPLIPAPAPWSAAIIDVSNLPGVLIGQQGPTIEQYMANDNSYLTAAIPTVSFTSEAEEHRDRITAGGTF